MNRWKLKVSFVHLLDVCSLFVAVCCVHVLSNPAAFNFTASSSRPSGRDEHCPAYSQHDHRTADFNRSFVACQRHVFHPDFPGALQLGCSKHPTHVVHVAFPTHQRSLQLQLVFACVCRVNVHAELKLVAQHLGIRRHFHD